MVFRLLMNVRNAGAGGVMRHGMGWESFLKIANFQIHKYILVSYISVLQGNFSKVFVELYLLKIAKLKKLSLKFIIFTTVKQNYLQK